MTTIEELHVVDGLDGLLEDIDEVGPDEVDVPAVAGAITWVGAIAGAVLSRKAIAKVWTSSTGREPPENPAAPTTSWGEALVWAAFAGLVAGVARMTGRRVATRAAARLTSSDERRLA